MHALITVSLPDHFLYAEGENSLLKTAIIRIEAHFLLRNVIIIILFVVRRISLIGTYFLPVEL